MDSNRFEKIDVLYDQLPWYRKRWFMFITLLLFMPATIVITLTGDLYMEKNGEVYKFTNKQKNLVLIVCFVFFAINLVSLMGR